MATRKPTSYIVFLVVISMTTLNLIMATILSTYDDGMKYAMVSAFFLFIGLTFTTVGIYTGFKYRTEENKPRVQNKIGLVGNLIIFLFTVCIMAYAALTPSS
jgi:hypothetical protein